MNKENSTTNQEDTNIIFMMVPLLLGIFMGALDNGIVGPALSSIFNEFKIDSSWGVWSLTIYTMFFGISIPITAKLSDLKGRKKIFIFSTVVFALGSFFAAFSQNYAIFLIARVLQAIGAGGIFPITSAQISVSFSPEKRGRALGLVGLTFGAGTILGPAVGGLIISYFKWQWIFLINIPIALLILLLIARFRPKQEIQKTVIDYKGIFLLSVFIFALMFGITAKNIWSISLALFFGLALVIIEKKQKDPIINMGYFADSRTLTPLLLSLTSGFITTVMSNFLPLYLEDILHFEQGKSGLMIIPLALSTMFSSYWAGYLVDKIGPRKVLSAGFLIALLSAILLSATFKSYFIIVLIFIVLGIGLSFISVAPLNVLMLKNIPMRETGAAVGYVNLIASIGATMGPTMAGIILMNENGFSYLFYVNAFIAILSILILVFLRQKTKYVDSHEMKL